MRALIACVVFAGFAAMADRIDTLRERDIQIQNAYIPFLEDGGCLFYGAGIGRYEPVGDGGLELQVQSEAFAFNGPRCQTMRDAAVKAVKHALRVGDGGAP